jgi:hypothetical protein
MRICCCDLQDWCELYKAAVTRLMQLKEFIMATPLSQQQQQQQGSELQQQQQQQQVQQLVGGFYMLVCIAITTNRMMPYRLAAHVDLSRGVPCHEAPASHW